jgi:hypothetical protein
VSVCVYLGLLFLYLADFGVFCGKRDLPQIRKDAKENEESGSERLCCLCVNPPAYAGDSDILILDFRSRILDWKKYHHPADEASSPLLTRRGAVGTHPLPQVVLTF